MSQEPHLDGMCHGGTSYACMMATKVWACKLNIVEAAREGRHGVMGVWEYDILAYCGCKVKCRPR